MSRINHPDSSISMNNYAFKAITANLTDQYIKENICIYMG